MFPLIQWFKNRKLERFCLLLIGIIMGLLFWKLYTVLQRDFTEVTARLENGTMINLNAGNPAESMESLLKKGMYFEDPKDIAFIKTVVSLAKDTALKLDNLGELNKKKFSLPSINIMSSFLSKDKYPERY